MKNSIIKPVLITVCAVLIMACKKSETPVQQSEINRKTAGAVNDAKPRLYNHTGKYLKTIDTVCMPYLTYTTKLDISALKNNESYNQISDGNLTITVTKYGEEDNSLVKYDSATNEWWRDWNVRPFAESNNPPILFQGHKYWTRLLLSKKCYVFGIEVGAELKPSDNDSLTMVTLYYKGDINLADNNIADVFQDIKPPYSARLFAIKSDTPFDKVEIAFSSYDPHDYAIANIRYVTDKDIYDKHKRD